MSLPQGAAVLVVGRFHVDSVGLHIAETFEAMVETPEVCEHLHFPLQSGSDTILAAITDPSPKLRYTCAWGGAELPAGRARMTDEEWVALGAVDDDEAYYEHFQRLFGLVIQPCPCCPSRRICDQGMCGK